MHQLQLLQPLMALSFEMALVLRSDLVQVQVRPTSRNAIAALLDDATPLHAAALRGNPAQIDHLLFCKADPMARTAAGDSPLELVPVCEEQPSGEPLLHKPLKQPID